MTDRIDEKASGKMELSVYDVMEIFSLLILFYGAPAGISGNSPDNEKSPSCIMHLIRL
jgi:hypothetical protein